MEQQFQFLEFFCGPASLTKRKYRKLATKQELSVCDAQFARYTKMTIHWTVEHAIFCQIEYKKTTMYIS